MAFNMSSMIMVALMALRLAAALALTPFFTAFPLPPQYRLLLVVAIAISLAGVVTPGLSVPALSSGEMITMAMSEFALGILLASGIFFAFSAFAFAGRILDIQIGFGIAQVFDPLSQTEIPILTSIFGYVAIALFFLLGAHHAMLRGLAYTFEVVPPGRFDLSSIDAGRLISLTGKMFSVGFMLVAPVVFCIFIVEAGLALLARGMPQVNLFVISLPIKIVVGLLALSVWSKHLSAGISSTFGLIFEIWDGVFR